MLALASLVWTASDCEQRARLAEIGLTSMISLDEPLVRVAQETLDSLGRGSGLRLVLLPVPTVHGEVMTEVSRAAFLVARPRVVGVIGPTSSQAAMETASIYADRAVPHIVTTGTNRRLAWLGPWTFTLAPDDSIEAAFIAGFVRSRLAPGRLVLVQATDLYGWGIGDATASALERQGRALVAPMATRRSPRAATTPGGCLSCSPTWYFHSGAERMWRTPSGSSGPTCVCSSPRGMPNSRWRSETISRPIPASSPSPSLVRSGPSGSRAA